MCQRGNALIIVIAILFLLAAVAVSFERMVTLELRTSQNHQGTLQWCAAIAAAQTAFRDGDLDEDGVDDYATLGELCLEGLITGTLCPDASAQGYSFEVDSNTLPPSYVLTARPFFPGVTGNDRFSMDQSEVVLIQVDPNAAAGRARLIAALRENFVAAWDDLVASGLEQALGFTNAIAEDPNSHAVIIGALDPNRNGLLDEHELLDSDLDTIVAAYRARLVAALKLGQSDKDPFPLVPIAELAPNPFVFLDLLGALLVPTLG